MTRGAVEIDAKGQAVAPGFINMLSWADKSLIEDGRSQSDLRQGVTLEVMGEGWSDGPVNEIMKKQAIAEQGDIKYAIPWSSLGEYLDFLEKKGVSTNIASFIGATTVRIYVIGYENRAPSGQELDSMKMLVRKAMEDGAIGISSALIYAPASFSKTDELIELCKEASKYNGLYISHIRSEGDDLLQAVNELIRISSGAHIKSEIYHLKAAGKENWIKMDKVIAKIDSARSAGLDITADMYTYIAGGRLLHATGISGRSAWSPVASANPPPPKAPKAGRPGKNLNIRPQDLQRTFVSTLPADSRPGADDPHPQIAGHFQGLLYRRGDDFKNRDIEFFSQNTRGYR